MKSEFPLIPLGEVMQVHSGFAFKSSDMGNSGHPIIKIKNIKPPMVDIENCDQIPEEVIQNVPNHDRYLLNSGDTLIAMTGATVGKVGKFFADHKNYFLNQRVGKVYILENNLSTAEYIYQVLSTKKFSRDILALSEGSAQGNISGSQIEMYKIPLPPIEIQNSIGNILSTFDKKIRLNKKTNQTLEEIAKTLFKSWFIDFDPVRAKAEGRPTGLSKEISDLFPDSFEDSKLGEIPSGWKIEKLGHHINLTKGKSYKSAELQESDTALVTLKSFQRNGGYREDGLKEYIGSYKDEQIVSDGDLIVAFTDVTQAADVIGKPAIVIGNPNYSRLVISLDVGVIRVVPESILTNAFIYFLMLSNRYASNSLGYTNGTNVLHLKKEAITEYDFCLPNNNSLLKIYNDISINMLEKVSKNSLENITLEKLRDTLLPKLISGELKIPDAEKFIDEAGI